MLQIVDGSMQLPSQERPLDNLSSPFDLKMSILKLVSNLQDSGYTVLYTCENWPTDLEAQYAANIYDTVYEAVINICKHAHASTISLLFVAGEENLHVCIADDGAGMTPALLSQVEKQRFRGLHERVALLHGWMSIESEPNEGTLIDIELPWSIDAATSTSDMHDILTARERELLILLVRGTTIKKIATQLSICEKTVRNHISSLYRKLAVYDRVQLVVYALKKGWVDLHSL